MSTTRRIGTYFKNNFRLYSPRLRSSNVDDGLDAYDIVSISGYHSCGTTN